MFNFTGLFFKRIAEDVEKLVCERYITVFNGQIKADAPVDAFLSGDVGSSAIAALMQAQSDRLIKTLKIWSILMFQSWLDNEAKVHL